MAKPTKAVKVRARKGVDPIPEGFHTVTPYLALKIAQNDSIRFPFKEMRLPFDVRTIAGYVAPRTTKRAKPGRVAEA